MKRNFLYLCAIATMFAGCVNEDPDFTIEDLFSSARGGYNDGYFDWDRVDFIVYEDDAGVERQISLPWLAGSSANGGIPVDWLDVTGFVTSSDFSKRMYLRENGWRLVYSNLGQRGETSKYFALYNVVSGQLRFFLYPISTVVVGSNVFMGINTDRSTSLFNFTEDFALPMDQIKTRPSLSYSPDWQMDGTSFHGIRFERNKWYGFEMECAYDANVQSGSVFNFALWTNNLTITTGTGTTTGTIIGSIKGTNPNSPSLSLNFNTGDHRSITINKDGSADKISEEIEEGVKKGDAFFTGLWNNLKKDAGSLAKTGVKETVKAIASAGSSLAIKGLKGLFKSVFGGGGSSSSSAYTVDLQFNAETKFNFESYNPLPGFGPIYSLPIPGDVSHVDPPLYNEPLGVWNLRTAPTILVEGRLVFDREDPNQAYLGSNVYFTVSDAEPLINPAVLREYNVVDIHKEVYLDTRNQHPSSFSGTSYALIDNIKCLGNDGGMSFGEHVRSGNSTYFPHPREFQNKYVLDSFFSDNIKEKAFVIISLRLVSKSDPEKTYFHSKIFRDPVVKSGPGRVYHEYIPPKNDGSGGQPGGGDQGGGAGNV